MSLCPVCGSPAAAPWKTRTAQELFSAATVRLIPAPPRCHKLQTTVLCTVEPDCGLTDRFPRTPLPHRRNSSSLDIQTHMKNTVKRIKMFQMLPNARVNYSVADVNCEVRHASTWSVNRVADSILESTPTIYPKAR